MQTLSHKVLKALATVLCWLPVMTVAEPIYRWEGADGSTHYSHSPPAPAAGVDYDVLELDLPSAASPAEGDYRSILDVADSLEAARLERERLHLERERAALERQKLRQEMERDADNFNHAVPWFVFPHRLHPPRGPGKYSHPYPEQPRAHRSLPPEPAPDTPPPGRVVIGR